MNRLRRGPLYPRADVDPDLGERAEPGHVLCERPLKHDREAEELEAKLPLKALRLEAAILIRKETHHLRNLHFQALVDLVAHRGYRTMVDAGHPLGWTYLRGNTGMHPTGAELRARPETQRFPDMPWRIDGLLLC